MTNELLDHFRTLYWPTLQVSWPSVLAAGAHATTGSGLPFAGLSAALVAEMVGRAPRQ